MHWTMGTAIIGCVVNVKIAQQYNFKGNTAEDKKNIGYYMKLHKSFGLLAAGLLIPRLLMRRASVAKLPAALAGPVW